MNAIKFSQDEKEFLVKKSQHYFKEALGQQIGQFDAEFLLDFFSEKNRGLLLKPRTLRCPGCS